MLVGVMFNLIWSGITFVFSHVGVNWSAFYTSGNKIANEAINETFSGAWYVLLGSMIAMIVSGAINSIINQAIGRMMKKNNFAAYAARSYVSTAIGQFIDNLIFAVLVSYVFFGWTATQVVMCSLTGAVAELLAEVIFSPIGFRACKRWEAENLGSEYIEYNKNSIESL